MIYLLPGVVCTAYSDLVLYDLKTESHYILNNGVLAAYASINPTNDPEKEDQVMYLSAGGTINDTVYKMCELFIIINKNDSIISYFGNPTDTDEWQKPSWSTHEDYCTATAKHEGEYNAYIIDIPGNRYLRVVDGDLTYPYLWVPEEGTGVADNFNAVKKVFGFGDGYVKVYNLNGKPVLNKEITTGIYLIMGKDNTLTKRVFIK